MRVRGLPSVWMHNEVIPRWITQAESSITADKMKSWFISYIQAVVGRYRNKIMWWMDISEAIDDTSTNGRSFNLHDITSVVTSWVKSA